MAETPEELVRQALIRYLNKDMGVPLGLMAVEKGVHVQGSVERADIVIYDRKGNPWMVVECKAPGVALRQKTLEQVSKYNQSLKAPYILVTNGSDHICAKIEQTDIIFLEEMPAWK